MSRTTLKHAIIAAGALLLSFFGYGYMVYEMKKEERALFGQLSTLFEERASESANYQLERVAEVSSGDREKLGSFFLTKESDSIDVLNWIEGLAPPAGVTLETTNLEKLADSTCGSEYIEIGFTLKGARFAVERFITLLEHIPYLSQITALDFKQSITGEWEAAVTMKIPIFPV